MLASTGSPPASALRLPASVAALLALAPPGRCRCASGRRRARKPGRGRWRRSLGSPRARPRPSRGLGGAQGVAPRSPRGW
eukprot:8592861-Pyramimonas_sp.AAC.1